MLAATPHARGFTTDPLLLGLTIAVGIVIAAVVDINHDRNYRQAPAVLGSGVSSTPSTEMHRVGDRVVDGQLAFVVTDVRRAAATGDPEIAQTAGSEYFVLKVAVTNTGSNSRKLDMDSQTLIVDGQATKADPMASLPSAVDDLLPGDTIDAEMAFDIAIGTTPVAVVLRDSALTSGASVNLV